MVIKDELLREWPGSVRARQRWNNRKNFEFLWAFRERGGGAQR